MQDLSLNETNFIKMTTVNDLINDAFLKVAFAPTEAEGLE